MSRVPVPLSVALVLVPVALIVAGAGLGASVADRLLQGSPWEAFTVVMLPSVEDEAVAVQRLDRAGFDVLSYETTVVAIEDFAGGTQVPVARIGERFDAADPRLDPFVRALPGLFRVGSDGDTTSLIYLRHAGSPVDVWWSLRAVLAGIPYRVVGWDVLLPLAAGVATLLIPLPALIRIRRRRAAAGAAAGAVALWVASAGPVAIVPGVLLTLSFAFLVQQSYTLEREVLVHRRGAAIEPEQVPALVFAALSVLVAVVVPAPLVPTVLLIGILLLLWGMVVLFHARRVLRSEHRLFAPRRILRTAVSFPGLIPSLVLTVLIVVAVAITPGLTASDAPVVPVPEHLPVGQRSVQDRDSVVGLIEGLRSVPPEEEPLSTAGFLAHRWYQDTLVYGGQYRLPDLDTPLTIQRLRRDGGRLVAYDDEVARFSDEWIVAQFTDVPGSVYRLFVLETGAFRLVRTAAVSVAPPEPFEAVRALALLVVPLLALAAGMRLPSRGLLGTVGAASRSERHEL